MLLLLKNSVRRQVTDRDQRRRGGEGGGVTQVRRYHCAAGGEWREGRKEGEGGKEKGDKEGTGEGIC